LLVEMGKAEALTAVAVAVELVAQEQAEPLAVTAEMVYLPALQEAL
jgi:hypothetical protein